MHMTRRDFIATAGASAVAAAVIPGCASLKGTTDMYGLIGKMKVVPGQRDALISILIEGVSGMPGCLSYIVAQDPADPDAIWVTEVWDSQERHQASLSLPSVEQAILRGKPLITGFGERFETKPIGGHGLGARGAA
ncbi:MAG: antibiotic biosynthesis monooxygenase [Anaerolineae bacterium]|nr:antibiotic biosynthesis monooxygenase [Anaerolineae bacterium]